MATEAKSTATLNVVIRQMPGQDYLGRKFTSASNLVGHDVQDAFRRLYVRIAEAHCSPAGPPFLIASQPKDGTMLIEVGAPCVPVPEPTEGMYAGRLAASRGAVVLHRGPYDRIGPVYGQLFAWIAQHGYRPAGAAREVYLNGPGQVTSPAEYLTEVVVPIT